MNNVLFQTAQAYYDRGDFASALESYTQCLQGEDSMLQPGEIGQLYHKIGNCLVKLQDYEEAIHAYTQALADDEYEHVGAVHANLGNSYAALFDYASAVKHFGEALKDAAYDTPYKAYSGMGKAYLKLGKTAEAGSAFRSAALDEANPNPAQALLNLGICFMALGRPADAVASYESALQFRMNAATKNRLYANLGQANTACGQMQQAVDAFERALADKTYFLNDAASVDYQRAIGAVAQGTAVIEAVGSGATGNVGLTGSNDFSGLDVTGDGVPVYSETDQETAAQNPYYYADAYDVQDNYATSEERFFNASDEEIEQWGRGIAKEDRKRRNVGLKFLIVIIILLLIAALGGGFAYVQGYGFPSAESVVQQVFSDPDNASGEFSSSLDESKIKELLAPVVKDSNVEILGVEASMQETTVYCKAKTEEGGEVEYKVQLGRDMIGWKVTDIDLSFASQSN